MSHAIRQDLSKLSKIIVFCLKTPSRGIHQSDEIINNPQTQKNKRGYKDHYLSDKDTPGGRVNFPTTETGDSQ